MSVLTGWKHCQPDRNMHIRALNPQRWTDALADRSSASSDATVGLHIQMGVTSIKRCPGKQLFCSYLQLSSIGVWNSTMWYGSFHYSECHQTLENWGHRSVLPANILWCWGSPAWPKRGHERLRMLMFMSGCWTLALLRGPPLSLLCQHLITQHYGI